MRAEPRGKIERWYAPLAILYGALVFLPMLGNAFWADDYGWVSRAMDAIGHPELWLLPAKSDFRPLASLSFVFNLAVSELNPAGYYAFNLLLHLTVVGLTHALTRRVTGSRLAAGVAALLFAGGFGHYGEAIVWICGRTGPLADLFVLGSLIFHWDALEHGRARARGLSLACFAVALLAKESSVIALPLLVLLEWTHGARIRDLIGARLLSYVPHALLLGLYLGFQFTVLRAGSPILSTDYVIGPHALDHLAEYLVRMFLPVTPTSNLMAVPEAERPALQVLFTLLRAAFPLLWLWVLARPGSSRAVRFGVLWMVVTLLPYVCFTFRTSTRYLYAPAIGLALVLGSTAAAWWERSRSPMPRRSAARRWALVAMIALLIAQAAVMQVIIRRHRAEQRAQDPAPYRELVEKARALGLR